MKSTPFPISELQFALVLLLRTAYGMSLPYNPTHVFLSPWNPKLAYVIQPLSPSSQQFRLSWIDLSSADLKSNDIQSGLPFLKDSARTPFSVVIDGNGVITAFSGDCTGDGSDTSAWTLQTSGIRGSNAQWQRLSRSSSTDQSLRAEYLSSAVTFATNATGSSADFKTYMFGGMCPLSNSTAATWTRSATYSRATLKLGISSGQYDANPLAIRSPPVAQAGQSLTPLTTTFSNLTDGTLAAQQNFLLLGGHSGSAFLNLSQAALFSLPQETWTYLPISSNVPNAKLARRGGVIAIDPRSGHTAVLSSDGKRIVLFGGWIGDLATPASPQLAVLNVADGYGGSGDWQWYVPSPTGIGPPAGTGLYGHGSVMLPGNVMLVTGGYAMTPSSDNALQQPNTKSYLYNLTSNSWISDYKAPAITAPNSARSSRKSTQKIGLGIGLSVATVAVIALLIFYLWYKRHLRWKREQREDELRASQQGYVSDEWGMGGGYDQNNSYYNPPAMTGLSPPRATLYNGPAQTALRTSSSSQISARAALMVEIPNSTKGLRKSTAGRGPYPYERSIRNREQIHTIDEGVEENTVSDTGPGKSVRLVDKKILIDSGSSVASDPFIDPLESQPARNINRPLSDASATDDRDQDMRSWVSGWEKAAEEMLGPPGQSSSRGFDSEGRSSPTKSDRTLSSLSSMSAVSARSSNSGSGAVSILARTLSTRSAALLNSLTIPFQSSNTAGSTGSSTPVDLSPTVPPKQTILRKPINYGKVGGGRDASENSASAQPDFARLQAESETLLGALPSPPMRQGSLIDTHQAFVSPRGASSANPAGSWVGSVKRAIGMSSSPTSGRSTSLTASSARGGYTSSKDPSLDRAAAIATGSSASAAGVVVPRRSTSDAAFWKSKRGAKDWGDNNAVEEDEWDVESAAQNRVVQLMFTVPRERLRVVNADVDGRSIVSAEEDAGEFN